MKKNKHHEQTDQGRRPDQVDLLEPGTPPQPGARPPTPPSASADAPAQPAPSIAELQERIEKLTDSLARSKADFQNLQRRSATERSEAIRYANADVMKSLLGVLDDFERSLAAAETPDNLQAVVEGVRLVHQNLLRALTAHGLEPINALHQPFDPQVHEALLQQPTKEHAAGTVIEQATKGYRLHDRVLRPARVVVAKAVAEKATEPGESAPPPVVGEEPDEPNGRG